MLRQKETPVGYAHGKEEGGFTLLELAAASAVLFMALMSLAGVIVVVSHQREQVAVKSRVLASAQSLPEEIKGADPDVIEAGYDGNAYTVEDVTATGTDGSVLGVSVDSTNASLLVVTITGNWIAAGNNETLSLRTEVYKP